MTKSGTASAEPILGQAGQARPSERVRHFPAPCLSCSRGQRGSRGGGSAPGTSLISRVDWDADVIWRSAVCKDGLLQGSFCELLWELATRPVGAGSEGRRLQREDHEEGKPL